MKIKLFEFSYFVIIAMSILVIPGCATEGKSIALGGAVGAGTGAVLGGIVDPGRNGEFRTRNVIIGAAFGGMDGLF